MTQPNAPQPHWIDSGSGPGYEVPPPYVPGSGQPVPWGLPQQPVSPPKKKHRTNAVIGIVAAAAIVLCGIGVAATALSGGTEPTATPGSVTRTATAAQPAAAPEQPKVTYATPTPKDFVVTVKTMKKECYGSAGCLVTFNLDIKYNGAQTEIGKDWDVTYEVRGASEPYTGTFKMTGTEGGYTTESTREEMIQTAKSSAKLVAVVTAVSAH